MVRLPQHGRPSRLPLRVGPGSRVPAGAEQRLSLPAPPRAGQGALPAPAFTCLDAGGQRRLGQRLPGAGQQASPQQPRVALLLRLGGHRLRGRELQEGVPLLGSLGHAPQRRRLCPGAARAAPMGGGTGRQRGDGAGAAPAAA